MATSDPAPGTGGETPPPDLRRNQKMRTRQVVLQAAQDLVRAGRTPTVPEAADAALVSRATAYRYFPTQAALLIEAAMLPGLPTAESIFGGPRAPRSAADRVALLSDLMFELISSMEQEFRLLLREQLLHSIDSQNKPDPTGDVGVRLPLIDAALQPVALTLTPRTLERLRNALGVLIGTGAVVACRDVLRLDDKTAQAGLSWACRALVEGAILEDQETSQPKALRAHTRKAS